MSGSVMTGPGIPVTRRATGTVAPTDWSWVRALALGFAVGDGSFWWSAFWVVMILIFD